jgi:iron complex transport system substrate-binding protein
MTHRHVAAAPLVARRRPVRITRYALALLTASMLAACGDDETVGTDTSATDAPVTAAPAAPNAAAAGSFPVTIAHKYGRTTIDEEPQRIVSIGYGEHEGLLALGVTPIAVREWYGDFPYATWPWAQDELGAATPEVLSGESLNFEQIAALEPDLILGISSGMTDTDFDTLSSIAPTVAQPDEYIDYGTPWDVSLELTARAVGRSEVADEVIARIDQLFAEARNANPEFAGATAAVTFYFEEQPGVYASEDTRSRLLTELGFVIPEEIDAVAGDAFFVSISAEDLSLIDTDVVVWIGAGDDFLANIIGIPTRSGTRAFAEGREVFSDELLSGAFSHSSPLSLEYVVEALVPELAAAVDGDPATQVPSAVAAGALDA